MKAIGQMIREMAKAMRGTRMGTLMKAIFKEVKLMAREYITGLTVKFMMANGVRESKTDMECGKAYLVTAIWDNGKILKHMAMGCINGKTVIDMKEAGTTASNTEKALTFSQTVIHTQETMCTASQMAKVSTNGRMEAYTKEASKTA